VPSETNTSAGKLDDKLGNQSLANIQIPAYEEISDRDLDAQASLDPHLSIDRR